ncbi:MAG TPA: DUF5678 domain-containing protein [Candidatus Angelobacter sp.]
MATTPVSITPVITPYTLGILADKFERDRLPNQAQSLRKLAPFVEKVVDRCFAPLSAQAAKGTFISRFNKLAKDFGPIRLYLTSRVSGVLGNQDSPGFYEQFLTDTLERLFKRAREMDMGVELISAAVQDYIRILRAVGPSAELVALETDDLTFDQVIDLVNWSHAATRFDYGLTAVFLVLEGAIPEPVVPERFALLTVCQKALLEYGQAIEKIFVLESIRHVVRNLETSHIKITALKKGIRVVSKPRIERATLKTVSESSSRHTEMNWLKQNKDVFDRFAGHWIVIEKEELVANDTDYHRARETATQRGIKRPFIIFVPLKGSDGFMGI